VRRKIDGGDAIVDARLRSRCCRSRREVRRRIRRVHQGGDPLQAALLDHARHEEDEEFSALEQELSADELTKLAAAVEVAERIVPTHPHAGVESGAANLAVGPFVSLLDRDALGRLSVKRWQRCRHAELRDEVCLKPDRISGDHLTKELPGR